MDYVEIALSYIDSGLSIIPVRDDGSKQPALPEWTTYKQRLPTRQEAMSWWRYSQGFAVIGGAVSGGSEGLGLEVIDFDDREVVIPWRDTVDAECPGLLDRATIVQSPRGSYHIYYRCTEWGHNTKLAMKANAEGRPETMIETRGEGGYAITHPTPGRYHPSGRPWRLVRGSLTTIPVVTRDERATMLDVAMALNRYVRPRVEAPAPSSRSDPNAERIGDWYNTTATWEEILRPAGWKKLPRDRVAGGHYMQYWQRPGKSDQDKGCSATTGFCTVIDEHTNREIELLYVFSSNAWPFEPNTAYTKFTALTLLKHGGDFRVAARFLYSTVKAAA